MLVLVKFEFLRVCLCQCKISIFG